jgi:hypothetical protein
MSRLNFFEKTTVDSTEELDFLQTNFANFNLKYSVDYYRVGDVDLMRLDDISYTVYNTVEYWWIIGLINGVEDPYTGLTPGEILQIPNILDIYDFYKRYA